MLTSRTPRAENWKNDSLSYCAGENALSTLRSYYINILENIKEAGRQFHLWDRAYRCVLYCKHAY